MKNDPLNLDAVGFESIGRAVVYSEGFLEGLLKLKEEYEKIEHPQKNVREVANHSSVILDLQISNIMTGGLGEVGRDSYLGIKDLDEGTTTYPFIKRGIDALKEKGVDHRDGAYEYRENMFLVYKKKTAARENLFIRVE